MRGCSSCGAANPDDQRFCGNCGTPLAPVCPACGYANPAGQRFCGDCGSSLGAPAPGPVHAAPAPVAERRLVTVLFADLVGFTAASEGRDAEETRDLLSRYFELARTLISRYGGTVEKFIGDAVMAVWGTPVATEDDAERAVRAALDFVASVPSLEPSLRVRAGVLTGEAAVTLDADGQGMVAGDLVNTASRIQSVSEPGTVFVGQTTRRATERAIVYDVATDHELKGKSAPLSLARALRVVSGVGGMLKSAGLEAPFVGRERELALIKNIFHAAAAERRAHLVSMTGIAGIGKSRLLWEFYKYFDGIVEPVWWHRGRCLAYGEGVAYWALADMVRMRCRIGEDDEPASARAKLAATLREHVLEDEERAFIEPRLAHLVGFDGNVSGDRQDLFAAWRLFFERLADTSPVVLAFEDVQWADMGLLDFIEYLLEWAHQRPLFVITIGRPELNERRPAWGAGQRDFVSLFLDPLPDAAMGQLLDGLVPGLPDHLRGQILARAQGVPLYAVETVRMLLDRGALQHDGSVYRLAQAVDELEVPETLHALIAARLDGLSADERRLIEDAAVLGKVFTLPALAALAGLPEAQVEPLLAGLARKEVISLQSDPRSPERGQYAFLQDLVRHVAYETLARRSRYARHLAAAAYLETAFDQDEIAEVLAAHYVAAAEALPDADGTVEIRTKAREQLARAGERAGSLGANREGRRYYEQAAALAEDGVERAGLHLKAGRLAVVANDVGDARHLLERAIGGYREAGDAHREALALAALGEVDVLEGRLDVATERLRQAIAQIDTGEPTPELATALAVLGRVLALRGETDDALPVLERALGLAERFARPEVFVEALISKALVYHLNTRLREARLLVEAAAAQSREEQLGHSEMRALNNLAVLSESLDRFIDTPDSAARLIELARRRGDRRWEHSMRAGLIVSLFMLGRWDEAMTSAEELEDEVNEWDRSQLIDSARILVERGEVDAAADWVSAHAVFGNAGASTLVLAEKAVRARVLRAQRKPAEALAVAESVIEAPAVSPTDSAYKSALIEGIEAAFELGDLTRAEALLGIPESLDRGMVTPFLRAHAWRFRARLDAACERDEGVDERFRQATALLHEFGFAFYVAVTRLEHAEWLVEQSRAQEAAPLLAEARATFEELRARPWLERAAAMAPRALAASAK